MSVIEIILLVVAGLVALPCLIFFLVIVWDLALSAIACIWEEWKPEKEEDTEDTAAIFTEGAHDTNNCVMCNAVIPEGRLVCPNCENKETEVDND